MRQMVLVRICHPLCPDVWHRLRDQSLGYLDSDLHFSPSPTFARTAVGADEYWAVCLDDPRSSTNIKEFRSGRLYGIVAVPGKSVTDDVRDKTSPGACGMSLYTLRVSDIDMYHGKVSRSSVSRFSDVRRNEFGEKSFTFVAPDGYWWQLCQCDSMKSGK
jgi:hypothetical protein